MTDRTRHSSLASARSANANDRRCHLAADIETDLAFARNLHNIAQWVDAARAFIDNMDEGRECDSELANLVRKHGIGCGPDWGDEENEGRAYLSMSIETHLRELGRLAGFDGEHDVDQSIRGVAQ